MLVDRFLASIECTLLMKSSLILTDKCLDYINYSFQSLSHFGKFQLNTVNRDLLTQLRNSTGMCQQHTSHKLSFLYLFHSLLKCTTDNCSALNCFDMLQMDIQCSLMILALTKRFQQHTRCSLLKQLIPILFGMFQPYTRCMQISQYQIGSVLFHTECRQLWRCSHSLIDMFLLHKDSCCNLILIRRRLKTIQDCTLCKCWLLHIDRFIADYKQECLFHDNTAHTDTGH